MGNAPSIKPSNHLGKSKGLQMADPARETKAKRLEEIIKDKQNSIIQGNATAKDFQKMYQYVENIIRLKLEAYEKDLIGKSFAKRFQVFRGVQSLKGKGKRWF